MNDKYTEAEIAAGEARMASILKEYARLGIKGLITETEDRREEEVLV